MPSNPLLHLRGRLTAVLAVGSALAAALAFAAPAALAAIPNEVSQPTIEGTLRQGQTLSAGNGVWANTPTSFTYQWVRCTGAVLACGTVSGQTASTYALGANDVGQTLIVLVTATNADGSKQANSKPSAVISGNVLPVASVVPAVSGTAELGALLTTTTGTWSGGPSLTVQWQRCNSAGKSCVDVTGATGTVYGLTQGDVGSTIVAVVTARNGIGTTSSPSVATAVIGAPNTGPPSDAVKLATGETSITAASVVLPQRLVVSKVTLTPLTIASRSTKVTVKLRILDTRGYAVSNARVSLLALPSDRASVEASARTTADGWATFTLTPKAGLPLKRGATVILFAQATKDGDTPLAGVSGTRLIQVKVQPA